MISDIFVPVTEYSNIGDNPVIYLGLSVDFTLHYAIMYKLSPETDR
jgi:hypothetical protein